MRELEVIAATRFAFGVGVGILLSRRIPRSQRHRIGWTLAILGALSTPPLIYDLYTHRTTNE